MASRKPYEKFHDLSIPSHSNPIAALHAREDLNNRVDEKGVVRTPDYFLHVHFVCVLPDEYADTKETLRSMKNRDRDDIIRMVGTRYSNLTRRKGVSAVV